MNQGKKKQSICISGFILRHSNLKQFFFLQGKRRKKWCFKMKQEYKEIKYFVYFVVKKIIFSRKHSSFILEIFSKSPR